MSVSKVDKGEIRLIGDCPIEDAEPLLRALLDSPDAIVDWRGCHTAHAAVIQILLMSGATRRGPAGSGFLRDVIEAALIRSGAAQSF